MSYKVQSISNSQQHSTAETRGFQLPVLVSNSHYEASVGFMAASIASLHKYHRCHACSPGHGVPRIQVSKDPVILFFIFLPKVEIVWHMEYFNDYISFGNRKKNKMVRSQVEKWNILWDEPLLLIQHSSLLHCCTLCN